MDLEQAQRFLAAARKGYAEQVEFFIAFPDRQAQREAVLAAQQVVELAQREMRSARDCARAGDDAAGGCEECGAHGPRWVWQGRLLCRRCATERSWSW